MQLLNFDNLLLFSDLYLCKLNFGTNGTLGSGDLFFTFYRLNSRPWTLDRYWFGCKIMCSTVLFFYDIVKTNNKTLEQGCSSRSSWPLMTPNLFCVDALCKEPVSLATCHWLRHFWMALAGNAIALPLGAHLWKWPLWPLKAWLSLFALNSGREFW